MLTEKEKKWLKKHGIYFTYIDIFDITVLLILGKGYGDDEIEEGYEIPLEKIEDYFHIDLEFLRQELLIGGSILRSSNARLIDIVLFKKPELSLLVHELIHTIQHIFNHLGLSVNGNAEGEELSAYLLEYLFKEFSPYLLTN